MIALSAFEPAVFAVIFASIKYFECSKLNEALLHESIFPAVFVFWGWSRAIRKI
jgi:hypothetical protein